MMYDHVKAALKAAIPAALLTPLLNHHRELRRALLTGDWEKCLVRGGKFAEVVMKIIHYLRTKNLVKSISVQKEIQEAEKDTSVSNEIRMMIPRHVRALYDHRSNRGGAHSSFDPNDMDSRMVVAAADWILGEFIRVCGGLRPSEAATLVQALISKRVPVIESIDGDLFPLMKKASARAEIGVILYSRYPERTERKQLLPWVSHSPANVRVSLNNMKKSKEVHENSSGLVLSSLGVRAVEDSIRSYLEKVQDDS